MLAALTLPAWALTAGVNSNQQMAGTRCTGMRHEGRSMARRMKTKRTCMASLRKSADEVQQDIDKARLSNDPGEMKLALNEAETWITTVANYSEACVHPEATKGEHMEGCMGTMGKSSGAH